MKQFLNFAIFCLYILCAIGGTAYLFYYHKPLFAVSTIALAAMAFPTFKKAWDELNFKK